KGLNVSVGSKSAWLDVDQIDELSWDNCDIALRLVRRSDWATTGLDLCDSLIPIYQGTDSDTIWKSVLNGLVGSESIEQHYQESLTWLTTDNETCGGVVAAAWHYDLAKHATLECKEAMPEFEFDHKMQTLIDPQLSFDQVKQIGGGWSKSVPLVCADVCSYVKIELLVMDYWCNWGRSWSDVWVEDKSPLKIVKPVQERIDLTCKVFKQERTDLGAEFTSIYELAMEVDQENAAATAVLDEIFGTFKLAWRDGSGGIVDSAGANLVCEIPFVDSICICQDSIAEVLVYDHDQGWINEEQATRHCFYIPLLDTFANGAVIVNCSENVQICQDLELQLDACGQGLIHRTWKMWRECHPGDPGTATEMTDTVFYTQTIYVGDGCDLDPGMFTLPLDTAVTTCVLEFDPSGSGKVFGSAHPDSIGQPSFLFDDDCRLVGIGYTDKVLEEINSDTFCYKILRTWCFADWCNIDGDIPDNWFADPDYEGILFKYVQKILVTCECRCELECSALRDTSITCADIPSDVTDLFVFFGKPDIVHPDTNMICDFTLDSLIQFDTNSCGFGAITRTWYLLDEMDQRVDSCTETIQLNADSIEINRQTSYGGDAEPFNCSDSLIIDPIDIIDACPKLGAFSVSNDSPYAENDSNDASGNYPVGIHFINYKIYSACLDTIFLTDTITVIDDVNPSVVAFSDPCVSFAEWESDFNGDPLNPDIRMMLGLNAQDNCEVDTIFLVGLDSMFFPDQMTRDSIRYTYQWQARDTFDNLSDVKEVFILVSDSCQITMQSPV
ncbi:MAG: hypothetical protein OEQ53_21290, partial [Saprospiraceae bacterium]|nr:hypothetical protein [Saprospiraceae bacterium]